MDALPDELLCALFGHIEHRWLSIVSLTCSRWRSCARTVARARGHDLVIPAYMIDEAAARGLTSLVVWLRVKMGHPWTAYTLARAASHGHLHLVDCMRLARASVPPCPMDGCVVAAGIAGGGSRMLRKLRAHGCPCGPMAATVAVVLDDWESLRVLAAAGCTYDARTVIAAVSLRRRHAIKRLGFRPDDVAEAMATLADVKNDFSGSCSCPCIRCDAYAFVAGVSITRLVDHLASGVPLCFVAG